MSKKTFIAIICLIIVLMTLRRDNRALKDAETQLISGMLKNEYAVQVFGMDTEGYFV